MTRVWPRLAAPAEAIAAIAAATALVAALESVAPVASLAVLYLPAVLLVAIRRGQVAALLTALGAVVAFNFFFIEPRHHLTIASSKNVAAPVVFLMVAVVVGRLAASARERARESGAQARAARAREREAALLAEVAALLLSADAEGAAPLDRPGTVQAFPSGTRIGRSSAPAAEASELASPLPVAEGSAWLYLPRDAAWTKESLTRMAEPLARLLDVATERRRLMEQAAETEATLRADALKTSVLHAISHDLRSPLTAITTAGTALRDPSISTGERDELLEVIEGQSERLERLVTDLLDLSRIQAGAADPRPDWCDLHDVAARAAEHVRAVRGEHPLELALPADLPLVRADPAQLERVLANLIDNAVKFSPDGAPVTVSGGQGGGRVTVRVTDRGRGIPTGRRQRVFEPFFSARTENEAARTGNEGSGLGLAICRGFVEANGGSIKLQSTPDRGTSFAISFPLVDQPSRVA